MLSMDELYRAHANMIYRYLLGPLQRCAYCD